MRRARPEDLPAVLELLEQAALPLRGVEQHLGHFLLEFDGETLTGCAGLEVYGDAGLLRSVAVRPEYRSRGVAVRGDYTGNGRADGGLCWGCGPLPGGDYLPGFRQLHGGFGIIDSHHCAFGFSGVASYAQPSQIC